MQMSDLEEQHSEVDEEHDEKHKELKDALFELLEEHAEDEVLGATCLFGELVSVASQWFKSNYTEGPKEEFLKFCSEVYDATNETGH